MIKVTTIDGIEDIRVENKTIKFKGIIGNWNRSRDVSYSNKLFIEGRKRRNDTNGSV